MAGISKALAFINSDPASAREVVRPAFGNLSDDIFNAVWKNNLAIFPGSPEMSSDGVDKAIVLNNISAETPYNGSPREVFTNRYL